MTPEYQFHHGALLHEIIITSEAEIRVALCDFHGRPDAYVFNGRVGLLIKHSTKRISPWIFTFSKEHVAELCSLRQVTKICFVGFVCGDDGFVCVRDTDFVPILSPTESDLASVRIDRRVKEMYRVSSSGNELDGHL
jgi:hypothetical protein